jgi:hypothetical protein
LRPISASPKRTLTKSSSSRETRGPGRREHAF